MEEEARPRLVLALQQEAGKLVRRLAAIRNLDSQRKRELAEEILQMLKRLNAVKSADVWHGSGARRPPAPLAAAARAA
jgi:hypothetical protein